MCALGKRVYRGVATYYRVGAVWNRASGGVRAWKARLPDSGVRAWKARLPGPCLHRASTGAMPAPRVYRGVATYPWVGAVFNRASCNKRFNFSWSFGLSTTAEFTIQEGSCPMATRAMLSHAL